jgi:hypothetical protein
MIAFGSVTFHRPCLTGPDRNGWGLFPLVPCQWNYFCPNSQVVSGSGKGRSMRFGGWQRIGIVASVVWFFVGGFIGNKAALDEAGAKTSAQLDHCVATNKRQLGEYGPYEQVWTPCWQQYTGNFMQNADGHWWSALAVGLIPIPIGWLLGSVLIFTGRWIGGGFEKNSN